MRDIAGGKLEMKQSKDNSTSTNNNNMTKKRNLLKYTAPPSKKAKAAAAADSTTKKTTTDDDDPEVDAKDIVIPQNNPDDSDDNDDEGKGNDDNNKKTLPTTGFWAIKCLGKNKIQVGGMHIAKGQVALLTHGTTLKLASHQLYFLLPKEATAPFDTMKVPNPAYVHDHSTTGVKQHKQSTPNKKGGFGGIKKETDHADDASSLIAPAGGLGGAVNDMHEHYTAEELMAIMDEAVRNNQWERRHQMVGTAVAFHGVMDAGRSKEIQHIAQREGGASR
jgi:hypothetical protein